MTAETERARLTPRGIFNAVLLACEGEPGPIAAFMCWYARLGLKVIGAGASKADGAPDLNRVAVPASVLERLRERRTCAALWRAEAEKEQDPARREQCLVWAAAADLQADGVVDRWRRGEVDG